MTDEAYEYPDPLNTDLTVARAWKGTYPYDPLKRKVFGNIPLEVHAKLMAQAKNHGLTIAEYITSLALFRQEYEKEFAAELQEQRKRTPASSGKGLL
jgi:hypothetical protein